MGITYNLKSDFPLTPTLSPQGRGLGEGCLPEDAAEEFDEPETIEALREILAAEGHEVFLLGGDLTALEKIKRSKIDFVFNIAEGFQGRSREAHIPGLLELAGIPYSGSDPLALALTLDKSLAKRIALSLGIPTPEFWILHGKNDADEIPDQFPFFVKPLWEGSSKGIRLSSRVEERASLEREIERLFENYSGVPVLVEKYIPGQEVTAGVVGNDPPEVLGLMEIAFRDPARKDFCYSLEVKRNWKKEVEYRLPARLKPAAEKGIREAGLRLFKALGLRDVARFDFRVDPGGNFFFLEVNPLPGLSPESGDLVILAQKKGLSYRELILKIVHSALSRYPRLFQEKL